MFVLKTYVETSGQRLYDNERKALTALQDRPSDHIVGFYGSFTQDDTYNLVLEFVDGGNLLDFLKMMPSPSTLQDIRDFWTSYKGIFEGVQRIHQLTDHYSEADTYRLVQ
jgi:serine/threonine protein kinase